MDISSSQRLAAYTSELRIGRTRTAGTSQTDPAKAAAKAKANKSADASGVQVSLSASAQALSENPAQNVKRAGTEPAAAARKDTETTRRSPKSNRSLAVEAYQKNASAVPGSHIQVIA